ncbi:MAG: hypothetical protein LBM69_02075, partial [Lachnospiraceae bacterium]|nr:hypothetical protein [Lachnospiraceae bacterium]
MSKYDVNLNHHISYEIEVSDGVFWVPVNSLGKPNISDTRLEELVLTKDAVWDEIVNLADAIRFFRASYFSGVIDNVRIVDENTSVIWTYHKPGIHAYRTNEGCCAADSNWLCYVLGKSYEEVGCFG